jgi:cellulose synthase/poly-beta-1,6-N-acetylglucosamine synthase-like glycosyltransferase
VRREPVSVIVTVRNEGASVGALVESLFRGNLPPDEIVIADGGSTDQTLQRLQEIAASEPRLRVLSAPGNRSVGRNAAVRAARHEVIACTDAGVEVDRHWLLEITGPFATDPAVEVVVGFYQPDGATWFERAAGVISAPTIGEIDPTRFLPSTRSVAFRREAFDRVGGFDESLSHNEDTPFALALKSAGARFAFVPNAIVRWRPRGTLRAFIHQHRRFGIGDGESRVQGWFYRTIAAKYGVGLGLAILGFWIRPAWWVLGIGVLLFIASQARRGVGRISALSAIFVVPFLKVAYDLAYLSGYLKGRLAPDARR